MCLTQHTLRRLDCWFPQGHHGDPWAPGNPTARPARRLVSVKTAAEVHDVNDKTVRRWIDEGLITGYRIGRTLVKVIPTVALAGAPGMPDGAGMRHHTPRRNQMADSGIDLSRYEQLGDISAPFQVTKKHERRQHERTLMLEGMHCDVPPLTWE